MKFFYGLFIGALLALMTGRESLADTESVINPCSTEELKKVDREELIPLTPGEVLIPRGSKDLWRLKGVNDSCEVSSRYVSTSVIAIDLRYHSKNGNGKYIFSRDYAYLDCTGFDELIVSVMNEGGEIDAGLILETNIGEIKSAKTTVGGNSYTSFTDLRIALKEATRIETIKIDLEYVKAGKNGGDFTIFALILRKSKEFESYQAHWQRFAKLKWKGLLQPEGYRPSFKPSYGLFFSNKDLEAYRKLYGVTLNHDLGVLKKYSAPEPFIMAETYSSQCTRGYIAQQIKDRSGKVENVLLNRIGKLSFPALVCKNKELMRLAARYALSIASLKSWNDIPQDDTVGGGVWPAFTPSGYTLQLALAMDCAGEMLTRKGRDYVLKAMMLKGVAPITYSLWARAYAFNGNQAMVFLKGKMAGLAVFDKVWPRVMPALEDVKNQADSCFDTVFRNDGSYMESFAYLAYTLHVSSPIYEIYAQLKKKPITEVLPENIKKSGKFMQVLASTCKNRKRNIISIGQSASWGYMAPICAAFIAAAAPDSMWGNMYNDINRTQVENDFSSYVSAYGLRLMKLANQVKNAKNVAPDNLVVLKDCGLVSSHRTLGTEPVKIVMIGDALGVGKKHYDVGSFILEFAGDVFAMDMPVYSGLFSDAQYHNMLVALDRKDKLTNSLYYTHPDLYKNKEKRNSMRPWAKGGEQLLCGSVNPSCSWNKDYFEQWERTIDSPVPSRIMIMDQYKLGQYASGAAFIWLTYLPCELKGGKILIQGEHGGTAELTPDAECQIEIEKFTPTKKVLKGMFLPENHKCSRIIITKKGEPGKNYKLSVNVKLSHSGLHK